jgi:hypothetical protein
LASAVARAISGGGSVGVALAQDHAELGQFGVEPPHVEQAIGRLGCPSEGAEYVCPAAGPVCRPVQGMGTDRGRR